MKATARKKPAFKDFYENGMFSRVIATRTSNKRWQLCGVHRNGDTVIFVEAARGGLREWSGLDYLSEFCLSIGVTVWEVHVGIKKEKAA
ncbi:hypothetical protein [Klebsiella michiganensis]|uniref:Bacteriophage protein n=1 Tax=Klebsiella michiganensis TaxID=1134687 RepID=A0A2J4QZB6_9ENTR|nr:hypothetical protein [Klebsiella michiganensis]MCY3512007.1 hypothetical protein [Klebsiella michiganensis]MDL4446139.1 hypothetical protein [Klebsiella michiganensis]MDL4491065.1 hypothetical protein [Klebsiella michiganensis]MDL4659808.1 hypothetical protein [Klebsiella michiganensis]PLL36395.1 hypothetical protein CWN50_18780 [Klebsiella michiganensis]